MNRSDFVTPEDRARGFSPAYRGSARGAPCDTDGNGSLQFRTAVALSWTLKRLQAGLSSAITALRCLLALAQTRFELFVVGYDHALRMISATRRKTSAALELDEAMELCRVVNGVGRRVNAKCLERSLAARRLLLAKGVDATLKIGVCRDEDGEFRAHAWLEYQNIVINDIAQVTRQFETIHDPGVSVH